MTPLAETPPIPPTKAALIEVEDVWRIYHMGEMDVPALRGVSMRVETGEFVMIMGSSGSGKSTLMSILGGLDSPTKGRYLLDGIDMAHLPRAKMAEVRNQRIGFVFQSFHLLARTSALENVELPLLYSKGTSRSERHKRAGEALERVGLSDRARHHPSQLSGGQQQRVAIARALVNRPAILFADEPTGNLDSKVSVTLMALFQELNDSGITMIFVTHEPDIAQYGKRKIVLRDGLIQSDESVLKRTFAANASAGAEAHV